MQYSIKRPFVCLLVSHLAGECVYMVHGDKLEPCYSETPLSWLSAEPSRSTPSATSADPVHI